jgi:hydroxyethylthiazole kinase
MIGSPSILDSDIRRVLDAVRSRSPLVHNVTNYVSMDLTANALLALGASPIMAHASEEVVEMATNSDAIVINIGTLSGPWVQSMRKAVTAARERHAPVIFDPAGVGATRYRTSTARMILEEGGVTVLRGNGSEIMAMAADGVQTRGVESTQESNAALDAARAIAEAFKLTVVVSGAVDHIVGSSGASTIRNGTPLMTKVTAMGCVASAVVGACCGVEKDSPLAAYVGMAIMGVSGDLAEERLNRLPPSERGPGTFRTFFVDALANLTADDLITRRAIDG